MFTAGLRQTLLLMRSEGSSEDPSGLALHIEPCIEPDTFEPRCLVSEMGSEQTVCVNSCGIR